MLVILLIIFVRCSSALRQKQSKRRCLWLIGITACYVLMDGIFIACDLWENCKPELFNWVVFVFYIVYVLLPFIWHIFVRNFVNLTFNPVIRILECIPLIILLALVICTPFTGALWTIGDDCTYYRGPFFAFYSILNLFYYVEPLFDSIIICIKNRKLRVPYIFQSMLISLIPLGATIGNTYIIPIYQIYPFQPFCSMIVALLGFFFMASKESDILQQQNQERIQEALNKAEDANRVKTDFLSNMSHDIRTPMNAFINLTQLALEEDDIAVIREYLNKMQISSQFLLGLINDILDMSKIENGNLNLHKENLTRTEFINTVTTVIYPLMEEKHINFHPELNPGKYTISVDKLRFNQIFFNLLSNAAKFTPDGGDVWFEVTNLEEGDGKLTIKFVVRDNGIGMSEDFLNHLFEPFAREHSHLSDQTKGTGLGLPIVKSLVDAMGGTIAVKSKLGEGSEFTVKFTVDIVSKDEHTEDIEPTEDTASIEGLNVLLVEDNDLNTYVALTILEKAGCIVTTAKNGKEGLDIFTESEPFSFDVILMDVRMPIMNGLDCAEAIRAMDRPDAKDIPIIAMTADAFDDDRNLTIEAGMDYHLSKPVDAKQLYTALAKFDRRTKDNKE